MPLNVDLPILRVPSRLPVRVSYGSTLRSESGQERVVHAEVAYLAHQGDGQPPPSPGRAAGGTAGGAALNEDCSAFFAILPVGVLGRSATKSNLRGIL